MDEVEVTVPPFFYELKKNPLFKHAVIAGGFLRDQYLHINPSDVDIFVPTTGINSFIDKFLNNKDGLAAGGPIFREIVYQNMGSDYMGKGKNVDFIKFDCKTNDGHDVDIMAMRMNVEDFGNLLIESFPFGNQQVFHDGKKVFYSELFENDINNRMMTLHRVSSMEDFLHVYEKYQKMNDRYRKELGLRLRYSSDYILVKRKGDDWL